MNEDEIRGKILERLERGVLPRSFYQLPVRPVKGAETPEPGLSIKYVAVTGQPCSACDADGPIYTFTRGVGQTVWFHERCYWIYSEAIKK